jgi:hypothetical protein
VHLDNIISFIIPLIITACLGRSYSTISSMYNIPVGVSIKGQGYMELNKVSSYEVFKVYNITLEAASVLLEK